MSRGQNEKLRTDSLLCQDIYFSGDGCVPISDSTRQSINTTRKSVPKVEFTSVVFFLTLH